MKQYIHPKLWRRAFQPKYNTGGVTVETRWFVIEDHWPQCYSEEELLALWFEEVVEDGKERFSQKYVDEYNTKNQRACISSFLRDHNLLEE